MKSHEVPKEIRAIEKKYEKTIDAMQERIKKMEKQIKEARKVIQFYYSNSCGSLEATSDFEDYGIYEFATNKRAGEYLVKWK